MVKDIPPDGLSDDAIKEILTRQEGIYNREAAELLKKNGITVMWNRYMMREHNRLFRSKPLIPMSKLK